MEKLISIIVPVFNIEKYVEPCILSLINQTYSNFEIIIVDDGSTDNSGQICDNIAISNEKIKVIHKENGGLSDARNCGIKNAKGDFLVFVDGDDIVKPNYLSSFPQDADLCIQGYVSRKDKNDSIVHLKEHFFKENVAIAYCLNEIPPTVWTKLFRKDIIINNQIEYRNIRLTEDLIFTLEYLLHCHSLRTIDKSEYIYFTRNNNSLSQRKYNLDELMIKERFLFSLYEKIFEKDCRFRRFMQEKTLLTVSKYYFFYNQNYDFIRNSFLNEISEKYLSKIQFLILNINYKLFSYYARWRRRFRRKILKRIFCKKDNSLINI